LNAFDMTTKDRRVAAIATGQRGNFTRRQANAGGISNATLRSRNQSGLLDKIGYHTFTSPLILPTALSTLHALMLDIGDPVWACGPTAAALHQFDGFALGPPFHLLTERHRQLHRPGHVVHTCMDLPAIDRETSVGLALTSPTRTLIDLARSADARQLTAALDGALRDGLTSERFLHERI
jgi:hypothetical protein